MSKPETMAPEYRAADHSLRDILLVRDSAFLFARSVEVDELPQPWSGFVGSCYRLANARHWPIAFDKIDDHINRLSFVPVLIGRDENGREVKVDLSPVQRQLFYHFVRERARSANLDFIGSNSGGAFRVGIRALQHVVCPHCGEALS